MDELDKRLVRELQGSLPQGENPYLELARRLGISEDEVVEQLKALKESGRLKRIAAVLRHQRSGYAANAMAVFLVPEAAMDMLGGKLAESPLVSHCYERVGNECWPYNLYAMIHGKTDEEIFSFIRSFAEENRIDRFEILPSVRELKKTSMVYFGEISEDTASWSSRSSRP